MFPDHYAAPEGLDLRLIGYVRWDHDKLGHYLTVLWRRKDGRCFFYEDYWTPYVPPFWWGVTPEELIPCDTESFCNHISVIVETVEDPQLQWELYARYAELLTVWGVLEGVEKGFAWAQENFGKFHH